MFMLNNFSMQRPRYEIAQSSALDWLAEAHAAAEATLQSLSPAERGAFALRMKALLRRCACGPDKIAKRGHVSADMRSCDFRGHELYDLNEHPRGQGTARRTRLYRDLVERYFAAEYASEQRAPSELIHVTCTGYVSPSGAQRVVADKGWGELTRVTHAYHMGCYAALPAVRLAAGELSLDCALRPESAEHRADIVHTELCSLHLDPSDHSLEQCVVQSLFADGFIRYSVRPASHGPGLAVLALAEATLPGSAESMTWQAGDFGMRMSLSRDVPERIASALRPFVTGLFEKAGLSLSEHRSTVFAIHPGGPKIIDGVRDILELGEAQIQASRSVLFDYGNMSSATLPHVWQRLLADPELAIGTPILSLAFGPGLTVCGGLFRKC